MDHDDVQPMGLREHTHMPEVGLLVNAAEDKTAPQGWRSRGDALSPKSPLYWAIPFVVC